MRIFANYDEAYKMAMEIKRKNKNAFIEKPRETSFGFPNGTTLELNVIEVYYESYDPVDGWVDNIEAGKKEYDQPLLSGLQEDSSPDVEEVEE